MNFFRKWLKPRQENDDDLHALDWGAMTASGCNLETNEALLIQSMNIADAGNMTRAIVFTAGKVKWADKHLPQDATLKILFDLRGQALQGQELHLKDLILEKLQNSNIQRKVDISYII